MQMWDCVGKAMFRYFNEGGWGTAHTHSQPHVGFMFNMSLPAPTEWLTIARWVNVTVSCLCSKLTGCLHGGYNQCVKLTLTQPPPSLLNGFFFTTAVFWLFFYPQSCDCNVKPLTGKHRRTTPLRRQRMLRFSRNSTSCCEPREDRTDESPVTNKQTATRQTPRI